MSVVNEEAIRATETVAIAAAGAYIDATALVAAVASVHETKKTAEEARHNMLEASRVAKAYVDDVQQKIITFDINAFECSTAVVCASDTAASVAAYAANATCEYADACEAVEAAKECLAVAFARIRLTAATAAKAAKVATPLVKRAAGSA